MADLPRSTTSFRRQGSSGLIWEDRYLSGELNQPMVVNNKKQKDQENIHDNKQHQEPSSLSINTLERNRSTGGGGRAFHSGKLTPAIEPPSPKVTACGFCGGFKKPKDSGRRPKSGKRRS